MNLKENPMKKRKIYLAGDMLNKGAQLQRTAEAIEIRTLGHEFYNPQDNKAINDKANVNPEGLAERIVKHDTDAIKWSDTVILEPLAHAIGTNIELGQVKGMRDVAQQVLDILNSDGIGRDNIHFLMTEMQSHVDREVFVHYQDIRRQGQTETGDRRSLGVHQYMYGVALDLTDGRGIQDWTEIKQSL